MKKMKKIFTFGTVFLIFCLALMNQAGADEISLFVDSAPNVYGSANWDAWETNAWSTAENGTFENMKNSHNLANAGTLNFELEDLVVYSFGDLGQRLHFVYWVPGQTIASLITKNFEVAMYFDWGGTPYDFYGDYYGSTWLTPSSWEESNGGVIGTAGFAWWAAYGVNTPEALDADLAAWRPYQGDITFFARMNGADTVSLTAKHNVPEPASLLLLSLGIIGLAGARGTKKRDVHI